MIVVERASFTPPTTSCCSSPCSSRYSSCSYWAEAEAAAAEELDDLEVVVVLVFSRVRGGEKKERNQILAKEPRTRTDIGCHGRKRQVEFVRFFCVGGEGNKKEKRKKKKKRQKLTAVSTPKYRLLSKL